MDLIDRKFCPMNSKKLFTKYFKKISTIAAGETIKKNITFNAQLRHKKSTVSNWNSTGNIN